MHSVDFLQYVIEFYIFMNDTYGDLLIICRGSLCKCNDSHRYFEAAMMKMEYVFYESQNLMIISDERTCFPLS